MNIDIKYINKIVYLYSKYSLKFDYTYIFKSFDIIKDKEFLISYYLETKTAYYYFEWKQIPLSFGFKKENKRSFLNELSNNLKSWK